MKLEEYLVTRKKEIEETEVKHRDVKIPINKNFIVSIIGPRRTGKTYLLYYLIKSGLKEEEYAFVNFEEMLFIGDEPLKIPFLHQQIYGTLPSYLFFDEIQALKDWEKVVYNFYEKKKFFIFITGSSSKLLSKEIATQLRGRSISVKIYPLSFNEILKFRNIKIEKKDLLNTYAVSSIKNLLIKTLKKGCFPDIVLENIVPFKFFREYFDVLIYKDLMERYRIRERFDLEFFLRSIVSSFAKEFSVNKIFSNLKGIGVKTSRSTLYNFQKVVEDVQFAFFLRKYERSLRKAEMGIPKVYLVDNGFYTFLERKEDLGRLMENFVFLELIKSGLEVGVNLFYFRDYQQNEVDFVIKDGLRIKQLIQVTYASGRDEIREREIKALVKASDLLKCKNLLCITWDYEDEEKIKGKKIKFLPLWKWLLKNLVIF